MNSNRMKYASTPTYGMQKRNFSKKQAAAQPTTPTPDFTQQPLLDPNTAPAPFGAQNAFLPPTGAFVGAGVTPNGPMFVNAQPQTNSPMIPGVGQPMFGTQPPANNYPNFMAPPQTGVSQGYPQAMGNAMPPFGGAAFSGMMPQGYTPGGYPQGGALPPNVIRSEPVGAMGGINPMQNGMNMPAPGLGMNGFPAGNGYGGFAGGGMSGAGGQGPGPYPNSGYPQGMMNVPMGGNGFQQGPYGGMNGGSPAMPTPKPPIDVDQWLKVILYGVLPVLFIPCLFVTHTFDFLRYLFIILAVVTLSVVWYRQSFTQGLRTAFSVAYLALCVIVIATLVGNNRDVTQTANTLNSRNAAQATAEPTASVEAAPLNAEATPSPVEDPGQSEAEQRLATFMDYWTVNRVEDMVNLVMPSWASAQDSPAQALFTVISNRTPQEYNIEGISGLATDNSRTVTMSAYIDKNNGKDPVRYRFMILMVKESGEWYVDPNSLATNDTVEATPTVSGKEIVVQSLAPRMTVTPIPDPSTKLYYNANGGKYYHADPNCSAVNPKFLPMASFLYSELDDPPYNSLSPCLKCGAPTQSLGSLKTEATATPAP